MSLIRVPGHLGVKLPAIPAPPSPRQPTTVGHRGLLLALNVRMDGVRKMQVEAAKTEPARHPKVLVEAVSRFPGADGIGNTMRIDLRIGVHLP